MTLGMLQQLLTSQTDSLAKTKTESDQQLHLIQVLSYRKRVD